MVSMNAILCVFLAVLSLQPEGETAAPWLDRQPGELLIDSTDAGVHNVRLFHMDNERVVLSGSLPEQDAGFDSLHEMGVTTVISVDAAMPDLERAQARGMRYIHIPIKYGGITTEERTALALALKESEGTVYVHCHHGKHRGPAAAAIGLVGMGACEPGDGVALMEHAGTSEAYRGLWDDVAGASEMEDPVLASARPMLVEMARVEGLPGAMAEMDRVFDHLLLMSALEWQAPAHHPDLSARSESGQLTDLFRVIESDEAIVSPDPAYDALMQLAASQAELLELQIETGRHTDAIVTIGKLRATCKACHAEYR